MTVKECETDLWIYFGYTVQYIYNKFSNDSGTNRNPPFKDPKMQYVCPGERLSANTSICQVPSITEPLWKPS